MKLFRFSFIKFKNVTDTGADTPADPWRTPPIKPHGMTKSLVTVSLIIEFGFCIRKNTNIKITLDSPSNSGAGLRLMRSVVPIAAPIAPDNANLITNLIDLINCRYWYVCQRLVTKFGITMVMTAVCISKKIVRIGTTTTGAPTPIVPFKAPPNRNAKMIHAISE